MNNATLLNEYASAVARLAAIARHDTSGSRAAAQVLLSAYNGDAFHLDVTDLCVLDQDYLEDALTVLRARAQLSIEPHQTLTNGNEVFADLWARWKHLLVTKRYQRYCEAG